MGADGEEHGAGGLLAPVDPVLGPILLACLGAAVVVILIVVEAKLASTKDPGDGTDSTSA